MEPLRSMLSSRTKEALARKRSEGKRLGRPKGKLSSVTKLSGKDDLLREYLDKKMVLSQSSIFGAKSKNRVSEIQRLTDCQTLEKATLRQNPGEARRTDDGGTVDLSPVLHVLASSWRAQPWSTPSRAPSRPVRCAALSAGRLVTSQGASRR